MSDSQGIIGPILFLDRAEGEHVHLAALFITPKGVRPAAIRVGAAEAPAGLLAEYRDMDIHRARFTLPQGPAEYRWNGQDYPVCADLRGDARLGFVSCNGEETGDMEREGSERNVMWARLRAEHAQTPLALLLHGGDQVYADEVTHGHPLTEQWPDDLAENPTGLDDLHQHLREQFLERYAALYAAPDFAWLAARVPSLMQWDDHDICDGWGSLRDEVTGSAIGRTLLPPRARPS